MARTIVVGMILFKEVLREPIEKVSQLCLVALRPLSKIWSINVLDEMNLIYFHRVGVPIKIYDI